MKHTPGALPTKHSPRSPGKLAVMQRRAKKGMPLFLPGDARMPEGIVILEDAGDPEGAGTLVQLAAGGGFVVLR